MGWKHTTEVLCQNNFQREKWSICCNQSSNITECALSSYIKPESSNLKIPACCSLFCHHEWRSFGPCFIYYMSVYPFFFFTALFPLPVSQNLSILQLSTSSVSLYEQVCVFAFYLSFLVPAGPGGKTSIIITNQTPVVSFSAPSVLFSVVHPMFLCSMRCHSQSMIYFFTHSLLPFFGALLQPSLLSLCFWTMSALCPFLPKSAWNINVGGFHCASLSSGWGQL